MTCTYNRIMVCFYIIYMAYTGPAVSRHWPDGAGLRMAHARPRPARRSPAALRLLAAAFCGLQGEPLAGFVYGTRIRDPLFVSMIFRGSHLSNTTCLAHAFF